MGDCSQSGKWFVQILLPTLAYLAVLVLLKIMNKREFVRCPEKGERYNALPLRYKLSCWFVVTPLFIASVFVSGAIIFIAIATYVLLDIACVRWYRKNGFYD
jgi:hypothetical protein